ncbi:hypothetical protein [Nocardia lijiangensis]|uniref:hypothetical protein n=1 Tax=Nocardia lijiangensis TaxID=299618 RepID=UPI003D75D0AD
MGMASANSGWRIRALRPRNFGLRAGALSGAARRELLIRGTAGSATILGVRKGSAPSFARPFGEGPGPQPRREPGHVFWVRVQIDGELPYETRVRQRVREQDLEWMQPADVVACRVDPGDRDRLVLYVPDAGEATRVSIAKVLADGRRADATVLAAAPVAADYSGRDDPVLRLDLELRAWDEPVPWRVRLVQPVPLAAIGLVDLGQHLEVAFFAVDRGESVAVDWAASLGDE